MNTRRIRVAWQGDAKVTGLWAGPIEGDVGIVLAHGAGAGQQHPFMAGLRRRLADSGISTLSFDYPYIEAGRKAPDRLERLIACHQAVIARCARRIDRIALVGKSMGGRVGGHVAAEVGAAGVVFLGYPLIPLGKSEPRSTEHLGEIRSPILFVQGERDRMGPPDRVAPIVDRLASARLEVVPDASHGFGVPKRTGFTADDILDRLSGSIGGFAASL